MSPDPAPVALDEDGATVDMAVLADGLGLDEAAIAGLIRQGRLTSRFEKGVGADEGRSRLTFWIDGKRFRIVVDADGNIVQRFRTDFGGLPRR